MLVSSQIPLRNKNYWTFYIVATEHENSDAATSAPLWNDKFGHG